MQEWIEVLLSFATEHKTELVYPPTMLPIPDSDPAPRTISVHGRIGLLLEGTMNYDVFVVLIISILHPNHDHIDGSKFNKLAGFELGCLRLPIGLVGKSEDNLLGRLWKLQVVVFSGGEAVLLLALVVDLDTDDLLALGVVA